MYFDIPCTSNFNHRIPDSQAPSRVPNMLYFCGSHCEFSGAVCGLDSSDWHDCRRQLDMPCYWDYADCPVIQLFFGMCFSWYLSHNQPPFWTEKSPRTLLRAWTAIIRKTALHATKQSRWKNTFFGSILWCKASKQQGDNDSQPANCFLNSIMRIWLESIVSRIYSFVC